MCFGSHWQRVAKWEVDRAVNNSKAHYHVKIDPRVFKRCEVEVYNWFA